jgi:hypothetical protein
MFRLDFDPPEPAVPSLSFSPSPADAHRQGQRCQVRPSAFGFLRDLEAHQVLTGSSVADTRPTQSAAPASLPLHKSACAALALSFRLHASAGAMG